MATAESGNASVSYNYDAQGLRTSKTVDGVTYDYTYLGNKLVRQSWGGNTIDFAYDDQGRPYSLNYNGNVFYYILNLQGDVVRIVNSAGVVRAEYTYNAWGELLEAEGALATINPLWYRGYVYDQETGLYYLNSRYYDPANRRMLSPDDLSVLNASPTSLNDKNLYTYCDNNPVNRYDSDGRFWAEIGAAVAVTSLFVAIGALIVATGGVALGALVGGGTALAITPIATASWSIAALASTVAIVGTAVNVFAGYSASEPTVHYYSEHRSTKNGKHKEKHENGNARRKRDQGGEKKKQNSKWQNRGNKGIKPKAIRY